MTVSVVIPVYNAVNTVLKTLESLRAQTFQPFEIVVVDDGSTDGTTELLRKQKDILLQERPHRGVVSAANDGIAVASGEYLARMDADDWCDPERIEKQMAYLERFPDIGMVGCRVAYGGDRKAQGGYAAHVDWINTIIEPGDVALNRFVEFPFAHPSMMFRRELFEKFGTYRDGTFPEDYELFLRWMANGVQAGKVDEELISWNDLPTRLSRTDERYSVDAFYETKAKYLFQWLEQHNPHYPDVIVWGAGRVTRKRAAILEQYGIRITHYIDIKPRALNCGTPVIQPMEIPSPDSCFILPMVGNRGARSRILDFLQNNGFVLGENMVFCE